MGLEEGFNFKKKKQQLLNPEQTNINSSNLKSKQSVEPGQQPADSISRSLETNQSTSTKIDKTFEGEVEIYELEMPSSNPQANNNQTKRAPKLKIPIVNLKEI